MIRIFGDQNMRQQAWGRHTPLNRPARGFGLHDHVAPGATELGTEFTQCRTACWTTVVFRFGHLDLAWKMIRQRTARRLAACSSKDGRRRWRKLARFSFPFLRVASLQILQLQFELFNLPLDLLRFPAERRCCKRAISKRRRSTSAACDAISSCCFRMRLFNAAASSVSRSGSGAAGMFKYAMPSLLSHQ